MKDLLRQIYAHAPDSLKRAVMVRRRQPIWIRAGIVFVHIPKAAGTTINEALYGRFMGHVHAADVRRWGSRKLRTLPIFAVTRNPWDRLLSAYRFARRGGGVSGAAGLMRDAWRYQVAECESFDRFVKEWLAPRRLSSLDVIFQLQAPFVCDRHGRIIVDHLGKVENLAPTLEFIHERTGLAVDPGWSNRSGSRVDYRTFYTSELVDLVGSIYNEDITHFGYSFED